MWVLRASGRSSRCRATNERWNCRARVLTYGPRERGAAGERPLRPGAPDGESPLGTGLPDGENALFACTH